MADKLGEEKRINVVERPEWSEYDTAGDMGEDIFQNMAEIFSNLQADDVAIMAKQVMNNLKKKWTENLSDYEERELWKAVRDHDPRIEEFHMLIKDVISWAWEVAYTPSKADVEQAGDDAIMEVASEATDWLNSYDTLWELVDYTGERPKDFVKRIIENYIRFYQEDGAYDRYFIFDPSSTLLSMLLQQGAGATPRRGAGVLAWRPRPDIELNELRSELVSFLRDIEEPFMTKMFKHLKSARKGWDPGNRYSFDRQWTQVLKTDRKRVQGAKKAIKDFVSQLPPEPEQSEGEDA